MASKNTARWAAAILFWMLIIGCFYNSLRSVGLSADAATYIHGRAVTPDQVEERKAAEETAKALAMEWATFDGKNPKNYQSRMENFIVDFKGTPPDGYQKCMSAAVLSVEQEYSLYRVKLLLHIKRVLEVDEITHEMSLENRVITTDDVVGITSDKNIKPRVWHDQVQAVEVCVEVKDKQPIALGIPVITPVPAGKESTFVYPHEHPPQDFVTFAEQVLRFYYEGQDMENFAASGTVIPTLGGYHLNEVKILSFERKDDDKVTAMVAANISTFKLNNIEQEVVLEATKKDDKWTLTRIGSW